MNTAVATRPEGQRAPAPADVVRHQLGQMQSQFALALPEHVSPEKFVRVVMTAVQSNPDLVGADRASLFAAAMKCAQDGLLPDGREAALVVYSGKVSYLPMIAGVLAKVRRSGEMKTLTAHVVYANDLFHYTLGDEETIEHKPRLDGDRGKPIAAYAIAKTKDGGIYREVMSVDQVNQVRNVSRAKNNGPWVAWWDEMARKTVLRRLSKRLPMSTDLQQVFQRDDDHYDLRSANAATAVRRLHADFDEPADSPADAPSDTPADEATDAVVEEIKPPTAEPERDGFPGDKPAPKGPTLRQRLDDFKKRCDIATSTSKLEGVGAAAASLKAELDALEDPTMATEAADHWQARFDALKAEEAAQ